jgi:hypothetical protein
MIEEAPEGAENPMSATQAAMIPRGIQFPVFVTAATCAFAGVWMSVPLASVLLTERGASPALVGLYAAAVWVAALLAAPLSPWLAGRVGGALRLHQMAVVLSMLALIGLGTNPALPVWFLLGSVLGVASCLTWTSSDAIAGAMAPVGREGSFSASTRPSSPPRSAAGRRHCGSSASATRLSSARRSSWAWASC